MFLYYTDAMRIAGQRNCATIHEYHNIRQRYNCQGKKQLLFINEKQEAHDGSRYNEEALYQDQRC